MALATNPLPRATILHILFSLIVLLRIIVLVQGAPGVNGVEVDFNGINCSVHNVTYTTAIYVTCDPTIKAKNATPDLEYFNDTHLGILLKSDAGCPAISIDTIEAWIFTLKYPICILLILAGLYIGIYGKTMWRVIIFILLWLTFATIFLVISIF